MAIAQRLKSKRTWSDLVLPKTETEQLRQIAARVAQHDIFYRKSKAKLGIRALFAGAGGTGKTMAAEVIAFVEKHAMRGADIGHVRRRERWSVPPIAVREAVVNAVVHADYAQRGAPIRLAIFDDRLEVENPGLLPFGLTLEDLPRGISRPS